MEFAVGLKMVVFGRQLQVLTCCVFPNSVAREKPSCEKKTFEINLLKWAFVSGRNM